MQWAHVASGGAGGGMRWPNRHPHSLTAGMRDAQHALARFLPLIQWDRFRRREISRALTLRDAASGAPLRLVAAHDTTPQGSPPAVRLRGCAAAAFGCADDAQAVIYLLRSDRLTVDGRLATDAPPRCVVLEVPGLSPGEYIVTEWDTFRGVARAAHRCRTDSGVLRTPTFALVTDLALAVRRVTD